MGGEPGPAETVGNAARRLLGCIEAAEALIGERDATGPGFISGTQPESQPPWNTAAANAVLDPHAGARRLEAEVRAQVTGSVIERGGSDANTRYAITYLASAASAMTAGQAEYVASKMDRWSEQAMALPAFTGQVRLTRIDLPGQRTPPCPWCGKATLRADEALGIVICVKPSCPSAGEDGKRPWAQIDHDQAGRLCWRWPDGTIQP
jgi:hypothetical protein